MSLFFISLFYNNNQYHIVFIIMLHIYSPFTREKIDEIPLQNFEQAQEKLDIAYTLFKDQSKQLPAYQRIAILEKLISLMQSSIEELTIIAVKEGGKPYSDSKVEVLRAIQGVKSAIDTMRTMHGEQIPMGITESSKGKLAFTIYEPIGVVFAISAFNHPLNLIIHQVIPAIAAGTPIIIKPAGSTPRSCITLVDMIYSAGLPKEWCQTLICASYIAEQLVSDSRIAFLSFIGSAEIGWKLRSLLAPGTRCALEHGGIAPVVMTEDADWTSALKSLIKGAFYHSGQVCVSVQKIFVHHSICSDFTEQMVKLANTFKIGDPLHPLTEGGPLIHPSEIQRIHLWVQEAIQAGATLACGGKAISETLYMPTILINPPDDAIVSRKEIFGPVVCIYSYKTVDEAIHRANALQFGFQASVFTKNTDTAFYIMKKLNASAVMLNDHTAFRVDWMPFGGRDSSGLGWGGIPYSIKEYSREKMLVFSSPALE